MLDATTDVRLVVTRPDKPRGRSGRPRPSPVKEAAGSLGIPVAQPARRAELAPVLSAVAPFDVGVIVAFGMILDANALAVPRHGLVNIHFSLLPRWRGAAPVERAILAGDDRSGVSLMVLDEGLDTGPILASQATPIDPTETAGELTARLARMGATLLGRELDAYVHQRTTPQPQPDDAATYADRITSDEANLSCGTPAEELLRAIRAYSPRPGARFDGGNLKVWKAAAGTHDPLPAGEFRYDGSHLWLGTADDPIELLEVQPAGGRRMSGVAWARGRRGNFGRLP
jgi:methionyl-tRNA formyltransferase